VILPELASDETVLQLFIREARELGRVNSDAIVRYQGFLRDETGSRYLIMEFVEGESLKAILRDRRFEAPEVLTLLERIGHGLAAAHELGIIHRDISPENIIVPGGDVARAKLIDFGIAKSADRTDPTLIGSDFAGKLSFVSPEQAGLFGGVVDGRSDIYSFGLVLAAAALGFGEKLDMGTSPASVIHARQSVPDLAALPTPLRPLIGHMLQPLPADRPASIRALLEEAGSLGGAQRIEKSSDLPPFPEGLRSPEVGVPTVNPRRNRTGSGFFLTPLGLSATAGGIVVAAVSAFALIMFGLYPASPSIEQIQSELAAIVGDYRCADLGYSFGPDRTLTLAGYVSNDPDLAKLQQTVSGLRGIAKTEFQVRRQTWPACEAGLLLKPYFAEGTEAPRIALMPPGEPEAGQRLALELRAPRFDSYLYIDYFTPSGEVIHIFPNKYNPIAFRPALNQFVLGRPPLQGCWTFPEMPGGQLITVIASEHRLFGPEGPKSEPAGRYFNRLATALMNSTGKITATTLPFELTRERAPTIAATHCAED
jgi:hypothetical protein